MAKIPFRESDAVQEIVERIAKAGGSASNVQKVLKETFGKAYRRQNILDDMRRYLSRVKKTDTFKYIPKIRMPKFVENKFEWRFHREYNHYVKFKVRDKDTGEIRQKVIVISSSKKLTLGQIMARAQAIIDENQESYMVQEECIDGSLEYNYSVFESNPIGDK